MSKEKDRQLFLTETSYTHGLRGGVTDTYITSVGIEDGELFINDDREGSLRSSYKSRAYYNAEMDVWKLLTFNMEDGWKDGKSLITSQIQSYMHLSDKQFTLAAMLVEARQSGPIDPSIVPTLMEVV